MMAMAPDVVAANSSFKAAAAADQQPPSLILLQNEQIDRLKEELAEKNEMIFDFQISLATADAETQHRIAQVERETSLSVRRLEEELRRLQHEANRASSNNKRKMMIITAETTVTPPPAANNKNRSSSSSSVVIVTSMPQLGLPTAIETSAGTGAGATTTPLPATTVVVKVQAAARQDNALLGMHDAITTTPRISSAQRLLLHLVSNSSSTTTMLLPHHHATALLWQRLWLAQTDVQIAKILIDEYIAFAVGHHHAGRANNNNNTTSSPSTTAILQLLHQVLTVSPAACWYLVGEGGGGGKQHEKQWSHTSCQLRIGSSGDIVLSTHDHDLLNPLWTPTNTTTTTTTTVVTREAMDDSSCAGIDDDDDDNDDPSSPDNFINALWQTVVQYPTTIPAWDILRLLLRYHRLPWRDEQQTLVLRRLVAAGRSIGGGGVTSSTPRRQGSDDDNNDATTVMDSEAMDTTEADNENKLGRCCETTESSASSSTTTLTTTTTTPIAVWLPAAVRMVTEYVRRVDCWESLRSKPWATWLAVVLDLIEQQRSSPTQSPPQQPPDDDHSCQFACLQFLTVLVAQHHVRALDTFLRVEIVTDASTGELWHRAPSAVAVVCQRLTRIVAVDTTVTEEAYLLASEPSDMVLEMIRFVYYTVIAVQEGRRQEQSVALWDVCHPFAESLAGTSALLLERTQDPHTTHMLQVILDELEEDYNERYAKFIKDDRQPP
jgi:hypothetical protein